MLKPSSLAPRPTPSLPLRPPAPLAPVAPLAAPPGPGDLLAPSDVGERLGVSAKVLERWRGQGGGPAYVQLSRKTIRYRAADVEAFVVSRVRSSTASA